VNVMYLEKLKQPIIWDGGSNHVHGDVIYSIFLYKLTIIINLCSVMRFWGLNGT